ncbi:MAG: cation-transporting P-type ATPase, partial [Burkholderiaceae bacterium]|nr:cation-transporting P-type ATPase [Burkholderiaceae bacterium]
WAGLDGDPPELVWIGLAGLADPLRAGAGHVIAQLHRAGIDAAALRARHRLLDTVLRAEGRNYMATVHHGRRAGRYLVAVKGSPLEVLAMCHFLQGARGVIELTARARAEIARQNEAMAERQLRVLGFAYAERASPDWAGLDGDPPELVWIGLAGLADPLRAGAGHVIAQLHRAGIRPVMVTGDQRSTAEAIGKSLKLHNGDPLEILDAAELDQAAPDELSTLAAGADIFARVSPARKLQIVQALQASGKVVAMTGDGINDGPALQAADVGIAMGLHGTDFARSAADVVLQDDRLENVLEAIRLGRTITANIEKSLHFLISSNLSEILVTLSAVSLTGGAPLTPLQLLWMNLLSDVLPAIALVLEEAETDVMQQPPRAAGKALVGADELRRYALEGSLLAAGALSPYLYGLARYGAGPRSRALAFNALVLGQLLHAFSCRSERHGIFSDRQGSRNNKLNLAVGGSIALQLLANLVPGMRRWFGIERTDILDIAVTLAGAGVPLLLNEAVKTGRRKSAQAAAQAGGDS